MNNPASLDDIYTEQMKDPEFRRVDYRIRPMFDLARSLYDCGLRNENMRETAREAHIPVALLRQLYGAEGDPTISILVKLADSLDAHLEIRIVPNPED